MRTEATLTCRDTDDAAYWITRLTQADRAQCEALIDAMLALTTRLICRGITPLAPLARVNEGFDIYRERFGEPLVPF